MSQTKNNPRNIYKNSQNAIKIKRTLKYLQKKVLSHDNRLENALRDRFLFVQDQNFSNMHKTNKFFFAQNKKNCVF
jgi:hypothetical protein